MPTQYVHNGTSFVALGGGGGTILDQYPYNHLEDQIVTASTSKPAIAVTADAVTPHTWGAWVEVDPSLSADASGVWVNLINASNTAATNTSSLLQIGTGGSGSETAWATLSVGYCGAGMQFYVPGYIASGTRVAVRYQSVVLAKANNFQITFLSERSIPFSSAPVSYGVDTANSKGVTPTLPGSLNTKGAWTQITASTSADIKALLVTIQGDNSTTMSAAGVLVDIGVGGSGSEVVVISNLYAVGTTSEVYNSGQPNTIAVDIPAGSRIAARYQRGSTSNRVDVILVGAS